MKVSNQPSSRRNHLQIPKRLGGSNPALTVHHGLPARPLRDAKCGRTALSRLYYDLHIVP